MTPMPIRKYYKIINKKLLPFGSWTLKFTTSTNRDPNYIVSACIIWFLIDFVNSIHFLKWLLLGKNKCFKHCKFFI